MCRCINDLGWDALAAHPEDYGAMMQIRCPNCGMRDETEFVCAGTAHLARPPLQADDGDWAEYLFFRDNPKGMHRERWRHVYGCGSWFNVERDTVTHEIVSVYSMTSKSP